MLDSAEIISDFGRAFSISGNVYPCAPGDITLTNALQTGGLLEGVDLVLTCLNDLFTSQTRPSAGTILNYDGANYKVLSVQRDPTNTLCVLTLQTKNK